MVEVNLLGAMTATEVFLDQLRDGGGDLVNLSSVAGRTARPGNAAYAATKWGINGWSEALRQELQPGIRVIVIEPGAVATELPEHITHDQTKQAAEKMYESTAIPAQDIAEIIAFAVSRPKRTTINEILSVQGSEVARSQVFLETKIWISDYGYQETLHGFEKSARKLGVEQIDLLILHQALPSEFDRTLDAYRALETLLADGKVRAIGVSNFTVEHPLGLATWALSHSQVHQAQPHQREHRRVRLRTSTDEVDAIDALDTGRRGGPEPDAITLEAFGREIPET